MSRRDIVATQIGAVAAVQAIAAVCAVCCACSAYSVWCAVRAFERKYEPLTTQCALCLRTFQSFSLRTQLSRERYWYWYFDCRAYCSKEMFFLQLPCFRKHVARSFCCVFLRDLSCSWYFRLYCVFFGSLLFQLNGNIHRQESNAHHANTRNLASCVFSCALPNDGLSEHLDQQANVGGLMLNSVT